LKIIFVATYVLELEEGGAGAVVMDIQALALLAIYGTVRDTVNEKLHKTLREYFELKLPNNENRSFGARVG
jgi:hypothetical protein